MEKGSAKFRNGNRIRFTMPLSVRFLLFTNSSPPTYSQCIASHSRARKDVPDRRDSLGSLCRESIQRSSSGKHLTLEALQWREIRSDSGTVERVHGSCCWNPAGLAPHDVVQSHATPCC